MLCSTFLWASSYPITSSRNKKDSWQDSVSFWLFTVHYQLRSASFVIFPSFWSMQVLQLNHLLSSSFLIPAIEWFSYSWLSLSIVLGAGCPEGHRPSLYRALLRLLSSKHTRISPSPYSILIFLDFIRPTCPVYENAILIFLLDMYFFVSLFFLDTCSNCNGLRLHPWGGAVYAHEAKR